MDNIKRQGDMEIIKISESDIKNLTAITKDKGLTVGIGEVSGHSHLIRPIGNATIIEYASEADAEEISSSDLFVDRDEIFFEVRGGKAVILHEEHGPIVYDEGFYKRYNQLSYNPFEKRLEKVRD